ncbi:hypothetical protein HBN50_00765 [Halobacteriovorax sp. GB3]|uniref:matrixin family metalloprotease n=1 Tax=Halobacteriovorax sp. GB3 TaxID=2719615 RepID=UPI0023602F51|nr:matrixin family metalloprotease [Halobacteriovorax sp. GB3]MDD0851598.1 hypothetical protein [Halobacteriovorax sp. GB3]
MTKQWIVALLMMASSAFAIEVHKENRDNGLYIIDGDIPLLHQDQRFDFVEFDNEDKLIVSASHENVYDVWSDEERFNLSYCVSDEFAHNKDLIVAAFEEATRDWMEAANVRFVYRPEYDSNCNEYNNNVVFDIQPAYGERYLARAFFPNYPRKYRSVLVNDSSFRYENSAMTGFIRHELGHVLGFRHEHIHQESAHLCDEDNKFKPVTDYDKDSVMHYPHCGGTNDIRDMVLSPTDIEGARIVYP